MENTRISEDEKQEIIEKQPKSGKFKELFADERKFWQRMLIGLLLSLAFGYTFFVFGPIELFFSNSSFIPFTFEEMLPSLLKVGGAVCAALFIFSLLLRGHLFDCFAAIVFGILVAGYLQGNFLNLNLGALDGTAIAWQRYTTHALLNTALWGAIIAVPFIVKYFSRRSFSFMVGFVSFALIIMQTTALFTFPFGEEKIIERQLAESGEGYLSVENEFSLSPEENVVVFILDRCDTIFVDDILSDDPDFLSPMTGFTYFTNATSRYFRTYPAVAYLLTGKETDYSTPIADYQKAAWQESTFAQTLKNNGFDFRIYGQLKYVLGDAENGRGLVDNLKFTNEQTEQTRTVNEEVMLKGMLGLSAYRYVPHALKPSFWLHTGEIEKAVTITTIDKNDAAYTVDDPQFYTDMKKSGLTADSSGKVFTFYHLNGSHDPYTMDANSQLSSRGVTSIKEQTKGAFNIVFEYISQMKKLGVYDKSTIIVLADHGHTYNMTKLDTKRTICYMVKPAGEKTGEFTRSSAPISHSNFMATVLDCAGIEHSDFGTSALDVPDDDKTPRYFGFSAGSANLSRRDSRLITYKIVGNANSFSNWKVVDDIKMEYPFYDQDK